MEATPSESSRDVLVLGELVVDLPAHQVWVGRSIVHLSHLQFVVLEILVRNNGQVISAEQLAEETGGSIRLTSRSLRSTIWRLRARLGTGPGSPRIEVVQRQGYRLTTR